MEVALTTRQAAGDPRRFAGKAVRIVLAILTLPLIYFGFLGLLVEWPFSCSLLGPRDEICGSLPIATVAGAVIVFGLISCVLFARGKVRAGLITLLIPLVLSAYLLFG